MENRNVKGNMNTQNSKTTSQTEKNAAKNTVGPMGTKSGAKNGMGNMSTKSTKGGK